jgi:hypothetical protein
MAKKPTYGMLLSLIGGIILVIAGILAFVVGLFTFWGFFGAAIVGGLALVFGILIILLGYMGYAGKGKTMGLIVLILGILALFLAADFYSIGSILSILGGILLYVGM